MNLRTLAYILVISVVAVSMLGILGFGLANHSEGHACAVSAIFGGDCSLIGSSSELALHHLGWLQNLTHSIMGVGLSFAMLFMLAAMLAVVLSVQLISHQKLERTAHCAITPQKQFLRWLAIRNKREPHAV